MKQFFSSNLKCKMLGIGSEWSLSAGGRGGRRQLTSLSPSGLISGWSTARCTMIPPPRFSLLFEDYLNLMTPWLWTPKFGNLTVMNRGFMTVRVWQDTLVPSVPLILIRNLMKSKSGLTQGLRKRNQNNKPWGSECFTKRLWWRSCYHFTFGMSTLIWGADVICTTTRTWTGRDQRSECLSGISQDFCQDCLMIRRATSTDSRKLV